MSERVSDAILSRLSTGEFRTPHDDVVESMARELQQSRKRIAELMIYVQHLPGCPIAICKKLRLAFVGEQPKCTCGLSELIGGEG